MTYLFDSSNAFEFKSFEFMTYLFDLQNALNL